MRGTIVKGIAGFYYVKPEEGGEPVQCKARGVFRKDGVKPHVGDHVVFEWEDEELDGFVTEILPRTNQYCQCGLLCHRLCGSEAGTELPGAGSVPADGRKGTGRDPVGIQ